MILGTFSLLTDSPEGIMWEKHLDHRDRALERSEITWGFPCSRATLGPDWLKSDPKKIWEVAQQMASSPLRTKRPMTGPLSTHRDTPNPTSPGYMRLQSLNRGVILPDKTIRQRLRKWPAFCNLYLMHLVAARTASWVESSFRGIFCDTRYTTNSSRYFSTHIGLQWKPDTWYYRNTSSIHVWQAWKTLALT